jgi:hypothetical protein
MNCEFRVAKVFPSVNTKFLVLITGSRVQENLM